MHSVLIIGGGQLGSRHLQALKLVNYPLEIRVVDPSDASLELCRQRYEEMVNPNKTSHKLFFSTNLPKQVKIDICIVATSSLIRRKVVEGLIQNCDVKYMILEKLLFQHMEDYQAIQDLLNAKNIKAWVNCSMRAIPFYSEIKSELASRQILYQTSGSLYNLISNTIHYIDHLAFLSDCTEYTVNTDFLEYPPVQSKRPGYLELNGMLSVRFSNGSIAILNCFNSSNLPVIVEISSPLARIISREWEGKAWISKKENNWVAEERMTRVPYQSELTSNLVNYLLDSGTCVLVPFVESCAIHKPLHEALINFLNKHGEKHYDFLPFT